jgi:hypothetical protein
MLRRIPLALLLLAFSVASRADVLLERLSYPGMSEAAYAVSTRCTLDDTGQLAMHYRIGGELGSSRVQQMQLTLAALRAGIRQASRGEYSSEMMPVDAETWIYRAWKRADDGSYAEVVLFEENGGTGQKRVNQDMAARMLKNFIDLNCDGEIRY